MEFLNIEVHTFHRTHNGEYIQSRLFGHFVHSIVEKKETGRMMCNFAGESAMGVKAR